jgi:hypothetical protein
LVGAAARSAEAAAVRVDCARTDTATPRATVRRESDGVKRKPACGCGKRESVAASWGSAAAGVKMPTALRSGTARLGART